MKILLSISRILVGSLFIVSGLIKANDTIGFSFKLQEYFSYDVLNLPFLIDYTLPMAILICISEILLGLAIIIGAQVNLTVWSLFIMIIFFDFLTFYSAFYNKVTDCGCFGDAIKFTPWQSFYKDLILTILILILLIGKNSIDYNKFKTNKYFFGISIFIISLFSFYVLNWTFPVYFSLLLFLIVILVNKFILNSISQYLIATVTFILSLIFSIFTYLYLPIKDYRPYSIGSNITDGMKLPKNAKSDVYEDIWIYDINGEISEFTSAEKPWEIENSTFVDRKTNLIFMGDRPLIKDFTIESDNYGDITDSILNLDSCVLIVMYDIEKSSVLGMKKISELINYYNNNNIKNIIMSSNNDLVSYEILKSNGINNEINVTDETTLKTMIRSNPGIIILNQGVIINKFSFKRIKNLYNKI